MKTRHFTLKKLYNGKFVMCRILSSDLVLFVLVLQLGMALGTKQSEVISSLLQVKYEYA